jgi:hypothetical protein
MGVVQGTNRWNHLRGIRILPKRWGVVLVGYWNLPMHDATSSDVAFQAW